MKMYGKKSYTMEYYCDKCHYDNHIEEDTIVGDWISHMSSRLHSTLDYLNRKEKGVLNINQLFIRDFQ